MQTNLIGITGPARHGKDTVADMLADMMRVKPRRYAFAEPFKKFLHESFSALLSPEECKEDNQRFTGSGPAIVAQLYFHFGDALEKYSTTPLTAYGEFIVALEETMGPRFKYHPMTGSIEMTTSWRELYQITGTEWARNKINQRFWVENFMPHTNTIISDVRGYGAAPTKELRNTEAIAIREAGGVVIQVIDPRKEKPQVRDHSSEAGIDEEYIDAIIVNDGSLQALNGAVRQIYENLKVLRYE